MFTNATEFQIIIFWGMVVVSGLICVTGLCKGLWRLSRKKTGEPRVFPGGPPVKFGDCASVHFSRQRKKVIPLLRNERPPIRAAFCYY